MLEKFEAREIAIESDGREIIIGKNSGDYEEVVEVEETVRKTVTILSDIPITHEEAVDLVEHFYDKGEVVVTGDDVVVGIEVR